MSVEISQSALATIVQQAGRCANRDTSSSLGRHLRIGASDGLIRIGATDFDHWIELSAPCSGELQTIAVSAEKMASAVTGLNASTLTLLLNGSTLKIAGGGRRSIPTFDPADTPSPTIPEGGSVAEIDAGSLLQAIKFCTPQMHDNTLTHSHLCGVRMTLEANHGRAIGTNGVSVASIAIAATGDDFRVTLGKRFLDLLAHSMPEIGAIDFHVSARLTKASWPGGSLIGKNVEGEFLDVDRAMRPSSPNTLCVHAAELSAAIDAIADFGANESRSRSTIIALRMNGVTSLTARSVEGEGIEELASDWSGPNDYAIGFAASRASKLLRGFGANPISIEMDTPINVMIIRSDALPDRVGILAPVYL